MSPTALAPNFSTGFTGIDRYRPWSCAILDGVPFFANGFTSNWRWEPGTATKYLMGSVAPTTFALATTGAGGWLANGSTAFYYLEFYNSVLTKATAPQLTAGTPSTYGISVTNSSGGTRDVLVTWTDPGGEYDEVRIWRRLQGSDNFRLVAAVTASTATYTDSTTDATLRGNGTVYIPRYRTTLPPLFAGLAVHGNRLFGWTGRDGFGYYGQAGLVTEFVLDDFPDENILPIGPNDGLGPITAAFPFNTSLLWFKDRGAYEMRGDDVATWTIDPLFADRGALNPRCIVYLEGGLYVLDQRGIYQWVPGIEPRVLGASYNQKASPLQPIFDRMNLSASSLFFAVVDQTQRLIRWHVALDYEPVPNVAIVWDYGNNRFVGVDTMEWGTAGGLLTDRFGGNHVCRVDDLAYVWEEGIQTQEGISAGDVSGTVTAWSTNNLFLTCGAAAFGIEPTTGAGDTPYRLRNAAGTIVDENRAYNVTPTEITPYYAPASTPVATDTVRIGIVPAYALTGKSRMGSNLKKHIRTMAVEFNKETVGTLTVTGARDDETATTLREMPLTGNVRAIVPVNIRCRTYQFGFAQDTANFTFTIRGISVYAYQIEDRR